MQVKPNILAYYVTYIMYIFLFLFTCIVHISPPSPNFACHGIYINSIIHFYLPLAHNYFIIHVSKGQTDLHAKGFYCSSILIWNEITKCVNTIAPCFQFKILLKQYLQDNDLKLGF